MSNNNAVQGMSIQKKATNLFDYLKAMQKQNESVVANYEDLCRRRVVQAY